MEFSWATKVGTRTLLEPRTTYQPVTLSKARIPLTLVAKLSCTRSTSIFSPINIVAIKYEATSRILFSPKWNPYTKQNLLRTLEKIYQNVTVLFAIIGNYMMLVNIFIITYQLQQFWSFCDYGTIILQLLAYSSFHVVDF